MYDVMKPVTEPDEQGFVLFAVSATSHASQSDKSELLDGNDLLGIVRLFEYTSSAIGCGCCYGQPR